MTPIEIPEAAVDAALEMMFTDSAAYVRPNYRAAMREALAAAVPVMFGELIEAGKALQEAMDEPEKGPFDSLTVKRFHEADARHRAALIALGVALTPTITKEASGEPKRAARPSRGHNLVCSRCESKFSSDDQDADLCGICEADEQPQLDMDRDRG